MNRALIIVFILITCLNLQAYEEKISGYIIEKDNVRELRNALEKGIKPTDFLFEHAIDHYAIKCIKVFAEYGYGIGSHNGLNNTFLSTAMFLKNKKTADLLISKGADLTVKHKDLYEKSEKSIFYMAVEHGYLDIARLILEKRLAEVDEVNNYFWYNERSPLIAAIKNTNMEMARYLLAMGADPDLEVDGATPLSRAIDENSPELVSLLIEYGVRLKVVLDSDSNPHTYLMEAAGKPEIAKILMKAGLPPDWRSKTASFFTLAIKEDDLESLRYYFEEYAENLNGDIIKPAPATLKDNTNQFVEWAAWADSPKTLVYLLDRKPQEKHILNGFRYAINYGCAGSLEILIGYCNKNRISLKQIVTEATFTYLKENNYHKAIDVLRQAGF